MLLSSFGQATNDSISLFSSNSPIQSDTYKRLEVGDSVNLNTWFTTLGISGTTYKIIDGRVGTVNGSTLTTTNWGKTQVTATSATGEFRVIALEVRPKGAVAMPMVSIGQYGSSVALKANGTVWSWGAGGYFGNGYETARYYPTQVYASNAAGTDYLDGVIQVMQGTNANFALKADGTLYWWGGADSHNQPIPYVTPVPNGTDVVAIADAWFTSFIIKQDGSLWSQGLVFKNDTMDVKYILGLGDGLSDGEAVNLTRITAIDVPIIDARIGQSGAIALDCEGRPWQWGVRLGNANLNEQPIDSAYNGSSYTPVRTVYQQAVEVATSGWSHTVLARMILSADGSLWRWGYSDAPIRADSTPTTGFAMSAVRIPFTNANIPAATQAALSNIIHIRTSMSGSAIAQAADGTLYAWGNGNTGQLGTGNSKNTYYPIALSLNDPVQYGAGYGAAYGAVLRDGSVWGWGRNVYGVLGDNSTTDRTSPVRTGGRKTDELLHLYDVNGNRIPSTVTLGEDETLRIANVTRETIGGLNLLTDETAVTGGLSYQSIDTEIARVNANGIITPNQYKKYGETTIVVRDADGTIGMIRVRVKPKDKVAMPQVEMGVSGVTLAVKADGSVWAWGSDVFGLTTGTGIAPVDNGRIKPRQVEGLNNIVQATVFLDTCYALDTNGHVWSWGGNLVGSIGDGSYVPEGNSWIAVPAAVTQVSTGEQGDQSGYLSHIVRIAAHQRGCSAITDMGEVLTWGYNGYGGLGAGLSGTGQALPVYVIGTDIGQGRLCDVIDISAHSHFHMFLLANGTVFISGSNGNGTNPGLGNTTGSAKAYSYPVQILAGESRSESGYLENIVEIAFSGQTWGDAGLQCFYALNADGEIYSWGYGKINSLGLGDKTNYKTPKKVTIPENKKAVHIAGALNDNAKSSGGHVYAGGLAITEDRMTYTWGGTSNNKGILGNGTFNVLHPTPMETTEKAFRLMAMSNSNYLGYTGTKQDGTVWAWGWNEWGQIGDGYYGEYSYPEAREAFGEYTSIDINGAAIYRGSSAAAAYGADAGAAGTQCPGELWLSVPLRPLSVRTVTGEHGVR